MPGRQMTTTGTNRSGVSVILPNYNHGRFLGRQLEALATQSLPPVEILVIDDASTDDSLKIAESAAARLPVIRVLRNARNLGVNATVARGLTEARGEFLLFAAADDLALPGLMEKSLAQLGRHPQAGVCTALVREIDQSGVDLGIRESPRPLDAPGYIAPEDALENLYRHDAWFQCVTAVYRRSVFEELGGFDPRLESFADSFLCTVIALRHGVCFLPEPLACIRLFGGGFSNAMTSDIVRAGKMFGYARDRMTTVYRELFPDDFVDLWERRWRYTVGANLVRAGERNSGKIAEALPQANWLDRALLGLLMATGPMRTRLVPVYQLLRLTPGDFVAALARRLRRFVGLRDRSRRFLRSR